MTTVRIRTATAALKRITTPDGVALIVPLSNLDIDGGGFYWQPGGVSAPGIFTDWDELEAAVAATNGHRSIYVDSSLGPTGSFGLPAAIVPNGVHNFNPPGTVGTWEFIGVKGPNVGSSPTVLQLGATASGGSAVSFTTTPKELSSMVLHNRSTVDVFTPSGAEVFMYANMATYQAFTGTALFQTGANTVAFLLDQYSSINGAGGTNTIQRGGAGAYTVTLGPFCSVGANQLSGTTTIVMTASATLAAQASATFTVPTGYQSNGVATLSSGKVTVSSVALAAGSVIEITCRTPRTGSNTRCFAPLNILLGVQGSFEATAILSGADTINTADGSDVNWVVRT